MAKEGQAQVDKAIEGQFGKLPKPKKPHRKFNVKISDNLTIEAQEVRCGGCQRFVGYQAVAWGHASYYCHICKEFTTIEVNPEKEDIDNLSLKS
jgi:ribosomal protein L44E